MRFRFLRKCCCLPTAVSSDLHPCHLNCITAYPIYVPCDLLSVSLNIMVTAGFDTCIVFSLWGSDRPVLLVLPDSPAVIVIHDLRKSCFCIIPNSDNLYCSGYLSVRVSCDSSATSPKVSVPAEQYAQRRDFACKSHWHCFRPHCRCYRNQYHLSLRHSKNFLNNRFHIELRQSQSHSIRSIIPTSLWRRSSIKAVTSSFCLVHPFRFLKTKDNFSSSVSNRLTRYFPFIANGVFGRLLSSFQIIVLHSLLNSTPTIPFGSYSTLLGERHRSFPIAITGLCMIRESNPK